MCMNDCCVDFIFCKYVGDFKDCQCDCGDVEGNCVKLFCQNDCCNDLVKVIDEFGVCELVDIFVEFMFGDCFGFCLQCF